MKTKLVIAALLITSFFIGLCTRSYGVPGQTQNGGVGVSTPWFSGGLEIWGQPGFFRCSDGSWDC